MGLLSDFTAYVDSLKRTAGNALRETVNDPVGLLQMRLNQVAQQLPAYPGKESVMPGVEGGGLLSRPNVVDWGQAVAMNANQPMGLLGHTVYHGSPHKFDKFDASKIGTGEGAQAYGYGTYLAENRGVAKTYTNAGGVANVIELAGKKYGPAELTDALWKKSGDRSSEFLNGIMDAVHEVTTGVKPTPPDDLLSWVGYGPLSKRKGYSYAAKELKDAAPASGSLYAVDLPDEWLPKMLDWDKPLSQQPEEVRKAIAPRVEQLRQAAPRYVPDDPSGEWLYRAMKPQGGLDVMDWNKGGPRSASTALRDAGIPGIRYLDGGSRKSGEGTYNYVVFPGMEGLLKIISRE